VGARDVAEHPFMPVHVAAYLADTQHLSTIESGTYDLLLKIMWLSGGSLPLDDKFIARSAKLTPAQWRRMKPTIMAFMTIIAGSRFTQANLLSIFNTVRQKRAAQTSNARARWLKLKGGPDAMASSWHRVGNANYNKEESTLLVQSPTQPQKGSGSAEKKAGVASPESIEVTPLLKGNRLARAS
jgi:uncharacterized protein YdaU (DUF1376 family)